MPTTTNRTLLRNASLVLPGEVRVGSVLIQDGTILEVDAGSAATADQVIDCSGLHLMPGVIDDQVHFREPGLTHKEDLATASRAIPRRRRPTAPIPQPPRPPMPGCGYAAAGQAFTRTQALADLSSSARH